MEVVSVSPRCWAFLHHIHFCIPSVLCCVSYPLLHNQLLQNLGTYSDRHFFSCDSGLS